MVHLRSFSIAARWLRRKSSGAHARIHCAIPFVVKINAIERCRFLAAQYDGDATPRITSSIRGELPSTDGGFLADRFYSLFGDTGPVLCAMCGQDLGDIPAPPKSP
jgi:hypothetical protein